MHPEIRETMKSAMGTMVKYCPYRAFRACSIRDNLKKVKSKREKVGSVLLISVESSLYKQSVHRKIGKIEKFSKKILFVLDKISKSI